MTPIAAFQTTDGEIFPDQEGAKRHEFFLAQKEAVDEFLDSEENPYKGLAHRKIVQCGVIRWELWKAKNAK
jgi:hypothetical protein